MAVEIENFKPGLHSGELTRERLCDIAADYDPAKHEVPVCIGFPRHDQAAAHIALYRLYGSEPDGERRQRRYKDAVACLSGLANRTMDMPGAKMESGDADTASQYSSADEVFSEEALAGYL